MQYIRAFITDYIDQISALFCTQNMICFVKEKLQNQSNTVMSITPENSAIGASVNIEKYIQQMENGHLCGEVLDVLSEECWVIFGAAFYIMWDWNFYLKQVYTEI